MTIANRKLKARALADDGMTPVDIARFLSTPVGTVREWLRYRRDTAETREAAATLTPSERYRITDPALEQALSGAWR